MSLRDSKTLFVGGRVYFFAGGRVDFRKRAREGVGGDVGLVGERSGLGLVSLMESQRKELLDFGVSNRIAKRRGIPE